MEDIYVDNYYNVRKIKSTNLSGPVKIQSNTDNTNLWGPKKKFALTEFRVIKSEKFEDKVLSGKLVSLLSFLSPLVLHSIAVNEY